MSRSSQLHCIRNTQYAICNPPKSTVRSGWYCGCTIRNTQYALHSKTPLATIPSYAIRNTQYALQPNSYSSFLPSLYAIRCAIRNSIPLPQAVLRNTHFGLSIRCHSIRCVYRNGLISGCMHMSIQDPAPIVTRTVPYRLPLR